MLATNMIRKDLSSANMYEAGLTLSSLSCFLSPDLARDLGPDIQTLLTSTKPYLRKKGVLLLYKVQKRVLLSQIRFAKLTNNFRSS
jgi:AP-3 complex subunit delta-1